MVTRGDQSHKPGIITNEIIRRIVSDPLVVADLTGGNPNVFYELAIRHAVRKPIIQIVARGTQLVSKDWKLPFDVQATRVVEFDIRKEDQVRRAREEIIGQIATMNENTDPLETLISLALAGSKSVLLLENEEAQNDSGVKPPPENAQIDSLLPLLKSLPSQEVIPAVVKYMADFAAATAHVTLLETPIDDLNAACTLVENVPEDGFISATSSLQSDDADERSAYRGAVNNALQHSKVKYRKVICFNDETITGSGRHNKWKEEVKDKAKLIRQEKIAPDSFRLLHHTSPMSVDVLISQDPGGECLEMVAGFAGRRGHAGFYTDNRRMVADWLEMYLDTKIIAEAEDHTTQVWEKKLPCPCLEFLTYLEDARKEVLDRKMAAHKKTPRVSGRKKVL